MRTTKADACYIRYSSARQDGNTTIDIQLDACHKAAGGPTTDYIDKAKTGRAIAGREALLRLIDDAANGKIGRVFLYNWSRLGRSSETHAVVADLKDLGVECISITEGTDALARGVGLVVAQDYSRRLSNTVSRALEQRFSERTWTGGKPPLGLKVITSPDGKKRLAINEDEAAVVRQIFDWYLTESIGVKAIADRLRKNGTRTRNGADWSFTTVRGILINRTLTGEVRFKRRVYKLNRTTGTRRYKWSDQDKQLCYRDESIRIISDENFARAQARMAQRKSGKGAIVAIRQPRPLTGLIFCDECKSVFYAQKDGRTGRHYYGCSCRARRGKNGCGNSQKIREDEFIDSAKELFTLLFEDANTSIAKIIKQVESANSTSRQQSDVLKKEIAEHDRIIAGLQRLLVDPDVLAIPDTKKSIIRQCGVAEAKREQLRDALVHLGDEASQDRTSILKDAREVLEEAKACFAGVASAAMMHRFMEEFVGPIRVAADGSLSPRAPETEAATGDTVAALTSNVAATGLEPVTRGL